MPVTLRQLRRNLDISRTQIAHAVGVSFITYTRWEQGKSVPHHDHMMKLSEILEIPFPEIRKLFR